MILSDIQNFESAIEEYRVLQAKNYRLVSYVFAALGVVFIFVFFPIGLVSLVVAGWMYYLHFKSKSPGGKIYMGTVLERSTFQKEKFYEGDEKPTIYEYFYLKMEVKGAWSLEKNQPEAIQNYSRQMEFRVNGQLYAEMTEGIQTGFVLTPANDLIGYISGENLKFIRPIDQDKTADMRKISV